MAESTDSIAHRAHVPALDGIRGLAILLVMLCHFTMSSPRGTGLRSWLLGLTNSGWCGVDLFFVLSGYLITGILYDSKGTHDFFRNFYMRRVLRILPLYYGALALVFWVGPLLWPEAYRTVEATRQQQGWFWLHCSNFLMAWNGAESVNRGWLWLSHFWSLSVEEHFYLLWPALVFALGRTRLLAVCGLAVLLAVACRTSLYFAAAVDAGYVLTPCRMDALAIGAACALSVRAPGGAARLLPAARVAGGVSALALVALFLRERELRWQDPIVGTFGLLLLAIAFASLLLIAVGSPAGGAVRRAFSQPALAFLGKYSYGAYVIHLLLVPWVQATLPERALAARIGSADLALLVQVLFASGVTIGLALVSWHLFESRLLRLKRFFYAAPPRPLPPET